MDALKYPRVSILEKLKANREKHNKEYNEALEGWQESFIEEVTETLELAKSGKEFRLYSKLTKPQSYLKEYDRAIAQFQMSNQDDIQLNSNDFTQYVLDNWSWSESFATTYVGNSKLWKENRQ